ncbi:DUF333 domain-containing protein [Dryocola sp. LX212]
MRKRICKTRDLAPASQSPRRCQSGKLEIVKNPEGEVRHCNLPSGERIEELTLFQRDNSHETTSK